MSDFELAELYRFW